MIVYLFQVLDNSELFTASTGALIEIINGPDIDQYVDTVKKFLSRVLQLHLLMERKLDDDDMDACLQVCNLLVATLQANMRSLINVTEEDAKNWFSKNSSVFNYQLLLDYNNQHI